MNGAFITIFWSLLIFYALLAYVLVEQVGYWLRRRSGRD